MSLTGAVQPLAVEPLAVSDLPDDQLLAAEEDLPAEWKSFAKTNADYYQKGG